MNAKHLIDSPEYSFLKDNPILGKNNVCILGLGGSYAYGTNIESSDIDIRGSFINTKETILSCDTENNKIYTDENTDTTLYSLHELLRLLAGCNPNVIELLGLKKEHYIHLNSIGEELLKNKYMFLSQKCILTFGEYAKQQLSDLQKLVNNDTDNEFNKIKSLLNHIQNSICSFSYVRVSDYIKLYYDDEICLDVSLTNTPLKSFYNFISDIRSYHKQIMKISKRSKYASTHDKIAKHSMHLVRLYLMVIDLLKFGEVITYREKDHELLMSIRNGEFLTSDNKIKDEFFDIVSNLEKEFDYYKFHTSLPKEPDYEKIRAFEINAHDRIVKGEEL